ncbi:hypothetical protein BASA60_008732 [Batrachochytrium salamandrivorans]|nr:hypothetical protein BASA60_008732 [Batrachochytrium salamandrivorans]
MHSTASEELPFLSTTIKMMKEFPKQAPVDSYKKALALIEGLSGIQDTPPSRPIRSRAISLSPIDSSRPLTREDTSRSQEAVHTRPIINNLYPGMVPALSDALHTHLSLGLDSSPDTNNDTKKRLEPQNQLRTLGRSSSSSKVSASSISHLSTSCISLGLAPSSHKPLDTASHTTHDPAYYLKQANSKLLSDNVMLSQHVVALNKRILEMNKEGHVLSAKLVANFYEMKELWRINFELKNSNNNTIKENQHMKETLARIQKDMQILQANHTETIRKLKRQNRELKTHNIMVETERFVTDMCQSNLHSTSLELESKEVLKCQATGDSLGLLSPLISDVTLSSPFPHRPILEYVVDNESTPPSGTLLMHSQGTQTGFIAPNREMWGVGLDSRTVTSNKHTGNTIEDDGHIHGGSKIRFCTDRKITETRSDIREQSYGVHFLGSVVHLAESLCALLQEHNLDVPVPLESGDHGNYNTQPQIDDLETHLKSLSMIIAGVLEKRNRVGASHTDLSEGSRTKSMNTNAYTSHDVHQDTEYTSRSGPRSPVCLRAGLNDTQGNHYRQKQPIDNRPGFSFVVSQPPTPSSEKPMNWGKKYPSDNRHFDERHSPTLKAGTSCTSMQSNLEDRISPQHPPLVPRIQTGGILQPDQNCLMVADRICHSAPLINGQLPFRADVEWLELLYSRLTELKKEGQ